MAVEHPAESDEAGQQADYYMKRFASQGVAVGQPIELVVYVLEFPFEILGSVERRVREIFQCARVEHEKAGYFDETELRAFLLPVPFEHANVLSFATSLFRLAVEEGVTVLAAMA